jgi:hypothetical protein
MNEEQAVLDFFAKEENLSLGLSVAEQIDEIRVQMNSRFWHDLQRRVNTLFTEHAPEWIADTTEDRNASEVLVGLQCKLREPKTFSLFPMLEQQYLGGTWRIFFGLMWQSALTSEQLALPAVAKLKQLMIDNGFKQNENFIAWQWTNFHPRRSDFLLRYSRQTEKLLDDVEAIFKPFVLENRALIASANAALQDAPRSMTISLDQLRRKRTD